MEITLFKKQAEAFASPNRFNLCRTGIQGGKTMLGGTWMINEIWKLKQQGYVGDFLIAAPTVKILEQSTLKKFRPMFPSDWGTWNEQKKSFQLNWKNKDGEHCNIYVRSTEKPDFLEGMTILAAWLDEAGRMKEEAWINIQGRLSIFRGRALLTTTPYAVNWVHREVSKRAKQGDPDYAEFIWTSLDNPYFSREEFERMRKSLPDATFKRRYEGQFTRPEGLVYPDYAEDIHVIEDFEIPSNWRRFGGVDFGRRNAVICVTEDPITHMFYIYKEYYEYKQPLSKLASFLENADLDYILGDWSGAQVIDELRRQYGIRNLQNADKKPGSFDITCERIGELIKTQRIKFLRKAARNTIDEIESYHHKEDSDDTPSDDKPVKVKDHLMDGLRYAFSKNIKAVYKKFMHKRVRTHATKVKMAKTDPYTGYTSFC